mgnify:CR=1 FL=1
MKKEIIIMLLAFIACSAMAQDERYQLVIKVKDGSTAAYNLRDKPLINVSKTSLTVTVGSDTRSIDLSQLPRIYYETIPILKGDANEDGRVSVTDVSATINYILQKIPSRFDFKAADVSGDGKISIVDVTKTINILLGKVGSNVRLHESVSKSDSEIIPE